MGECKLVPKVTKLLTTDTLGEIRRLIGEAKEAKIIVPFWGDGAIAALALKPRIESIKAIVCNIESGACNPTVIRELIEIGYNVRSHERLHAKLVLTDSGVLVGSSNISANGLGFEGSEILYNKEASIYSNDRSIVTSTIKWVEDIYLAAHDISNDDLAKADISWKSRRQHRHSQGFSETINIVEKMRKDPDYFQNLPIYLWVRSDYRPSKAAVDLYERSRVESGIKNLAYYEVSTVSGKEPGSDDYILDYMVDEKNKLHWSGMWKFLGQRVKGGGTYIDLCVRASKYNRMDTVGIQAVLRKYVIENLEIEHGQDYELSLFEVAKSLV